ncbi:MAG TPA: hypothetical protein VGW33_14670 [Terriglobia bacterium]|nr:hypothetical protein [Terriglobia bacterium]
MTRPLKRRRRSFVHASVALLAAALLPTLLAVAEQPATKPSPENSGRVETAGALARHDVTSGTALRFWITVTNATSATVCGVRLIQLEAYDVGTLEGAVMGSAHSNCSPPSPTNADTGHLIAGELQPGQTATVWGEILPRVSLYDTQPLHAVIGWTTTAGGGSQALVPLGEIAIEGKPIAWLWYVAPAYQFLKDFALPIVVFLLGFSYKFWTERRESAKQEREKKLEEERLKQDKIQTLRAETWKQMLPESHALAKKYYAPVEAAIRWALYYMDKSIQETKQDKRLPDERYAFYLIILMGRRIKQAADEAGGFYFKSRTGEELAATCWSNYRDLFEGEQEPLGRSYDRAVGQVDPQETRDSFWKKIEGKNWTAWIDQEARDSLAACWSHFSQWYRTPEGQEGVSNLRGLRALINYEMNRPYEYWYEEKERIEVDDAAEAFLMKVAARIQQSDPGKKDFEQLARQYLIEAKGGA